MRPAKFKIESLGYEHFDGFTKGEDWNGWDCPYFTFDQSQKVVSSFNQLRQIINAKDFACYDSNADAFIFPSEDEVEKFPAIVERDQKFYPIGAFSWIWEEADK